MPVAPAGLRWHEEVDVGIVGAGGCGLVAAHAAAQNGLRIVVWERTDAPGGSTALSSGMIAAAGTRVQREAGIFETAADLARDILTRNGHRSDATLTHRLCERSADLVEWLIDTRSIALELVRDVCDPGHTRPRLHAPPSHSGRPLIDGLVRPLERRGIALRLTTPVLHLWTDPTGAVRGLQVKVPRKSPTNVRCRTLILSSGGFGANAELVAQHCTDVAGLRAAGAATDRGDALAWADDIGAAVRDLGAYEAHPSVALGSNLLIPWTVIANGAILVNQQGARFADETRGPAALVAPLRAQPGGIAYEIFDARTLKLVAMQDPHFADVVAPRALRRSDEVEGLAKQFQIDPAALARTVLAYNDAAERGRDTFGHPLLGASMSAPFYGIRVTAALVQTQGGLQIDSNARVLRRDGTVVPNLYAGGGAAVGLSGPGGDGYLLGTGLLCALGWGKIAGEQAAHDVLAARAGAALPAADPAPEGEA